MSIATVQRQASAAEMAAEIDRRGAVIDSLEAEIERLRDLFRMDGEQHAAHIKDLTERHEARITKYAEAVQAHRDATERAYGAGFRDAKAMAASVVRQWSLPTIQTPSMWLIDKAGIEADILAIELPARNGE
ncbi:MULTISPECIES: hypothetical protein [unclassified Chelatococcus]|uniref:hypothetical protein n=1 Tax=unclassified Chelatococcus TaxID=2638111 RepID=UPI001BD01AE4|nr:MULTISPECIES: hypothetical protein [unclassified Chelatococcus]CAH1665726.1 hypothetical protein CHELA41_22712 [Hyphomicrobiales bacterium]MBS7737762.1 hypothetical protein [Chelatococcus sp. HY11]MBX3547250.1 hypothetical protein [Chelatococcus sp.]MCO5077110.1 hypothetical protein [Chelatococcus sp.]CAH1681148.1 hypothetical protein CHELA20_52208 [Hyphomicrobiales bacterium]